MNHFTDPIAYLIAAITVILGLLIIGCWVEKGWLWLFSNRPQHFDCGRCELHGTDAEHDLHVAQNLPDPFTGRRLR